MIHIQNLVVTRNAAPICVVPKLSVEPAERVGIVGPNGSGKSTLLRVLAGLERTFEGQCDVAVAASQCVYVHQNPFLFRGTVLFNVLYGLRGRRRGSEAGRKLAMRWLEKLGIGALASRRADTLSGGERRRAALARALILEPRLLLLDEPLADLDKTGAALVSAILTERKTTTILIASPNDLPGNLTGRTHRLDARDRV